VLLLVDHKTRLESLAPLQNSHWSRLSASSPNRTLPEPTLCLLQANDEGQTLERVLSLLFAAAGWSFAGG